ncbi:YoaK family protein [Streptomyces sp. NPDC050610]|uniref:YoaK family protein n=1 Tax=Streptomyces sp. NPDC050610 TaxID=3157097 RepID=UPI003419C1C6
MSAARGGGAKAAEDRLPAVMLTLTVVSGFLDAVSYLGLGRVFTANMTGNVVVLGFAAAGAPGFSAYASLVSVAGFLLGAVLAGRFAVAMTERPTHTWFGGALTAEAALTGSAAAIAATTTGTGRRYAVVAVLAVAMGIRNSTVRRMAVPDMTTTVLTMTLTGLAADSSLAGGTDPRAARRVGSVLGMALGAFAGAWFVLHHGIHWPLAISAICVTLVALTYGLLGRRSG